MNVRLPAALAWWNEEPGGPEWLARLPELVEACVEQWGLTLGAPFDSAHTSFVAAVELPDRTPAVLKINFPDRETRHEADALAFWDGHGAVRLFAANAERRALVVERCDPGTELWAVEDEDEANRIAVDVLRHLWRPAPADHPAEQLAEQAAWWLAYLPELWERLGRPYERELLDAALGYIRELVPSQGELVVCHQDFHGGNVLASARGWLAIDAKPVLGERDFDTASLLRDRRQELARDPTPERTLRRRLDRLSAELGLDRERMRRWAVAHAVAWGTGERRVLEDIIATARWLEAAR